MKTQRDFGLTVALLACLADCKAARAVRLRIQPNVSRHFPGRCLRHPVLLSLQRVTVACTAPLNLPTTPQLHSNTTPRIAQCPSAQHRSQPLLPISAASTLVNRSDPLSCSSGGVETAFDKVKMLL